MLHLLLATATQAASSRVYRTSSRRPSQPIQRPGAPCQRVFTQQGLWTDARDGAGVPTL